MTDHVREPYTLPPHISEIPLASVTTLPSADPWPLRRALRMAERSLWVCDREPLTWPRGEACVCKNMNMLCQNTAAMKSRIWERWNVIQVRDETVTCVSLKAFDELFALAWGPNGTILVGFFSLDLDLFEKKKFLHSRAQVFKEHHSWEWDG